MTGADATDTVALPGGGVSLLVDNVTPPDRLVVSFATFTPTVLELNVKG